MMHILHHISCLFCIAYIQLMVGPITSYERKLHFYRDNLYTQLNIQNINKCLYTNVSAYGAHSVLLMPHA